MKKATLNKAIKETKAFKDYKATQAVQTIIQNQLATLERGFIATPASFEDLESFAKANHGSNDFLLTHMAMQYGMKLALEFLAAELAVEVGK